LAVDAKPAPSPPAADTSRLLHPRVWQATRRSFGPSRGLQFRVLPPPPADPLSASSKSPPCGVGGPATRRGFTRPALPLTPPQKPRGPGIAGVGGLGRRITWQGCLSGCEAVGSEMGKVRNIYSEFQFCLDRKEFSNFSFSR
jgi:hypothetical protein